MSVDASTTFDTTCTVTKKDIWEYRQELIQLGFALPEVGLIEALPGTGKSRGSMEWAANTGNNVTLLAPRHTLLDEEYEPWCEQFDLTSKRLASFYRDCPCFEKNDDDEYEPVNESGKDLEEDYLRGDSGKEVHARHSHSTCQANGECPFLERLDFDPEEYDVLLGTYRHAHAVDWIKDRYVVFDEFPQSAFLKTFDGQTEGVVSAYLQDCTGLPFSSHRDLLRCQNDDDVQASIEAWKDDLNSTLFDKGHAHRSGDPSAHMMAPLATLAVIEEEPLENDWGFANLGIGRKAALNPDSNNWTFLLPPDLSYAESVIGLDGTPNEDLWGMVLNEETQPIRLLSTEGKRTYLRGILGLRLIQTTEAWKAIQSGEGAAPHKDLAVIEGITRKERAIPALITSKNALKPYRRKGLDDLTEIVENYGNLKGMNKFKHERLGIILGNPHPGHNEIKMWSAFAGESAESIGPDGEELQGTDTDYGPFGNRVMHTLIHDEVLQAAMRFGREESDGSKGATVYIHTCAIPSWLPVEKDLVSVKPWTGRQKDGVHLVIPTIKDFDDWMDREWAVGEVKDRIDHLKDEGVLEDNLSNTSVRTWLKNLADNGYLDMHQEGQGYAYHFSNVCLEDSPNYGHVDFHGSEFPKAG